ncbi:Transposon Ty3-I Gag-Pol polyprotein [Gossypium australe]|uniref:Transposon Ty3-I Gag-Pol polyprotein n=1 Tax=Gossypium australe TaxID=47621 RepID=A0A5B6VD01_9ROSI|nr:Transposon Ty3-I Gag-Pol polyprotein [Gossypium australe]
MPLRHTNIHSVRSRSKVHVEILETTTKILRNQVTFSTDFHPQSDGQSERVIQVLKDMLRSCLIDFGLNWEKYIPLEEFAYNTSHHATLGMLPFEALYGRRRRSPTCWMELRPYEVLEQVGPMAYKLTLPLDLSKIYNVFHVSMLRRYRPNLYHVVQAETLEVEPNLSFEEDLICILEREMKELRNKRIPLVKVLWKNHNTEEATRDRESLKKEQYLQLFAGISIEIRSPGGFSIAIPL